MVEVSGVWAHEDITNNEVGEVSWEVVGHYTQQALSDTEFSYLDDVVGGSEDVVDAIEGKSDVGESVKSSASLIDNDSLDKWVNESSSTNDKGSARVDGASVASSVNNTVRASHLYEIEIPVCLLNDVVSSLKSITLSLEAGKSHVGFFGVVVEVETE